MKRVFVDTGGFFALFVAEDRNHSRARDAFSRAASERWQLITTNFVLAETYALLLTRTREGRPAAIAFLDVTERGSCRIERVRKQDEDRASKILRGHVDKSYSLCDALSFAVMERLRIREVVAFDRHFPEYGMLQVP